MALEREHVSSWQTSIQAHCSKAWHCNGRCCAQCLSTLVCVGIKQRYNMIISELYRCLKVYLFPHFQSLCKDRPNKSWSHRHETDINLFMGAKTKHQTVDCFSFSCRLLRFVFCWFFLFFCFYRVLNKVVIKLMLHNSITAVWVFGFVESTSGWTNSWSANM